MALGLCPQGRTGLAAINWGLNLGSDPNYWVYVRAYAAEMGPEVANLSPRDMQRVVMADAMRLNALMGYHGPMTYPINTFADLGAAVN